MSKITFSWPDLIRSLFGKVKLYMYVFFFCMAKSGNKISKLVYTGQCAVFFFVLD